MQTRLIWRCCEKETITTCCSLPCRPQWRTRVAWKPDYTAWQWGTAAPYTPRGPPHQVAPAQPAPRAPSAPPQPAPHTPLDGGPHGHTAPPPRGPREGSRTHTLAPHAKPCGLSCDGRRGGRRRTGALVHFESRCGWPGRAASGLLSRMGAPDVADWASWGACTQGSRGRAASSGCCPERGWAPSRHDTPGSSGPGHGEEGRPG